MVLAIDVDGILSDFLSSYTPLVIAHTGKDRFPPDYDMRMPPCWDFPPVFGYTEQEYRESFASITTIPDFWRWLDPEPGAEEFALRLDVASAEHDVFFLTNRSEPRAKQQTEEWLRDLGIQYPTVLVARDKLPFLRDVKANVFIEDNLDMANEVARVAEEERWPSFRMYLADRTYNRVGRRDDLIVVSDLGEMLDQEGL
jgi:5'(3')-deoxyribonucleotidase